MSAPKKRVGRPETPLALRMWRKVSIDSASGCWNWTASKDRDGYGETSIRGKNIRAHRAAWLLHTGEHPGRMLVCHKCDNPSCVNPDHLFLGTALDNNRDRHRKGRTAKGNARFTPADVIKMRRLSRAGKSYSDISRMYETSPTNVRFAVLGITWADVNEH